MPFEEELLFTYLMVSKNYVLVTFQKILLKLLQQLGLTVWLVHVYLYTCVYLDNNRSKLCNIILLFQLAIIIVYQKRNHTHAFFFCIFTEGALYYKKGKRLVVYDKEAAKQIFNTYHVNGDAHCGILKTRNAVCQRFYWPGITVDINKWVSIYLCIYLYHS